MPLYTPITHLIFVFLIKDYLQFFIIINELMTFSLQQTLPSLPSLHSQIHRILGLFRSSTELSLSDIINIYIKAMISAGGEEKEEKSNVKNSNPKIGRPAKTDQEEQFKNHYMENRKKFELECELLVYIHQIFFEEIPTHPTNNKIDVAEVVRLFEVYDCMPLYRILARLNELYYKSSSLFPEEKMRYTSLIDVSYLMRQVKIERGDNINSYELVLLVLFFLYNERVVNADFFNYFKKRLEIFRNGMINGPEHCELNKMDTLIITLGLEIAIRENMMIEEEIEDDEDEQEEEEEAATPEREPVQAEEPMNDGMQEEPSEQEAPESMRSEEEAEHQAMNDQ